jgi:hypothetical protein
MPQTTPAAIDLPAHEVVFFFVEQRGGCALVMNWAWRPRNRVDVQMKQTDYKQLTAQLGVVVCFARPYHSWERGLNENTNGLLRQYWPKSTDFKQVTDDEILAIVAQINLRPR